MGVLIPDDPTSYISKKQPTTVSQTVFYVVKSKRVDSLSRLLRRSKTSSTIFEGTPEPVEKEPFRSYRLYLPKFRKIKKKKRSGKTTGLRARRKGSIDSLNPKPVTKSLLEGHIVLVPRTRTHKEDPESVPTPVGPSQVGRASPPTETFGEN